MKYGTRRVSHFFYIAQYLLHQQIRTASDAEEIVARK